MRKLWQILKALALALAGIFVAYVAFKISRRIRAFVGQAKSPVPFKTIPGREDMILVEDGPESYAQVELPPEVKASEVTAVDLGESSATVEINHDQKDRRNRAPIADSALDNLSG